MTQKRGRGRPQGRTEEGEATRQAIYEGALQLFAERGYEGTTMRGLAKHVGVSPGLAYRYFPSKGALVMALYEDLSGRFARTELARGSWTARVLDAIRASLALLRPHREVLAGTLGVLLLDREIGLFAPGAAVTRAQVQGVFLRAVQEADDSPAVAAELGRIADAVQLLFILWMLLDRSPGQRATDGLVHLFARLATPLRVAIRLPGARRIVRTLDATLQEGLTGHAP